MNDLAVKVSKLENIKFKRLEPNVPLTIESYHVIGVGAQGTILRIFDSFGDMEDHLYNKSGEFVCNFPTNRDMENGKEKEEKLP